MLVSRGLLAGWILAGCAVLLPGGPTLAAVQGTAGTGATGSELVRTDLNFSIAAPSQEWTWETLQPQPDYWAFKATHPATRSQAVLSVVPLRQPLGHALADGIVAGMVESIVGRQPGFAEAGRSVKPSSAPRPGSFRIDTSLRNEAQGATIRVWGYVFAGDRLFSLFVLSTHDSGAQAAETLIGSFRFLREPQAAVTAPVPGLSGSAGTGAPRAEGATGVGVIGVLLVLLLAGLGWLVNKVAGRPLWDGARTALLLLLILLVLQIVGVATAGGPDMGRAVGSAMGTLFIPLAIAAWLSQRFQRAKTASIGPAAPTPRRP